MRSGKQAGNTIRGFVLGAPLGEGGMGTVYRAVEESSGQVVALKTVRVVSELGLAGLRREIRALARLRHPGIVRILADGIEDGAPWYAMEAVTGTSLRAVFRQEGGAAGVIASSAISSAPTSWWTCHPAVTAASTRRHRLGDPDTDRQPPRADDASHHPRSDGGLRQVLTCFRRLC